MCGLDWLAIRAINERKLINEGAIAEQFIGQHLLYQNGAGTPELCYWLREQKTSNAEVDYVIARGDLICPIKVKAGKSGTLKSLLQFVLDKLTAIAVRFDLNLPTIQTISHKIPPRDRVPEMSVKLISLPLYLAGQVNRVIDWMREKGI